MLHSVLSCELGVMQSARVAQRPGAVRSSPPFRRLCSIAAMAASWWRGSLFTIRFGASLEKWDYAQHTPRRFLPSEPNP